MSDFGELNLPAGRQVEPQAAPGFTGFDAADTRAERESGGAGITPGGPPWVARPL